MGTKVKDYILEINKQKQEAIIRNESNLIIRAGDLHATLDKATPSLIQCCSAMKQCMLNGDKIIYDKENKTGASVKLTIDYNLQDMGNRKQLCPLKKRGRPTGVKNKIKIYAVSEVDEVNQRVEQWIIKKHMSYESLEKIFLINDIYGLWMIPKYCEGNETDRFIDVLKLIREDTHKCSVVFKDNENCRGFWGQISEEVFDRLNMTALFVANNGKVTHLY